MLTRLQFKQQKPKANVEQSLLDAGLKIKFYHQVIATEEKHDKKKCQMDEYFNY